MPITSRNSLRQHFENGDIPSQEDFINVFDSFIHHTEDGLTLINDGGQLKLGLGNPNPIQSLHLESHNSTQGSLVGLFIRNIQSLTNEGWSIGQNDIPPAPGNADGKLSFVSHHPTQQGGNKELFVIKPDGTIGIGVSNPVEKLEVDGAIKVGNTTTASPADGTIRFAGTNGVNDLEVWMDGDWVSLTASGTDGVQSVNNVSGDTSGNVTLTTDNISDSGNANQYFTNARAIAATLTGYAGDTGSITSSDSIKSAIQKLDGNKIAGSLSTAGHVPYVGSANTLSSNSNFTFASDTLNLTRSTIGSSLAATNNSHNLGGASTIFVSDGGGGGLGLGYSGTGMYIRATSSNGIMLQGGGYYGVFSYSPVTLVNKLAVGYNDVAGAVVDIAGSSTARPSLRIRPGTAPSAKNDGDIWYDTGEMIANIGSSSALLTAWTKINGGINYAGGKVGIDVASPVEKLEVNGAIKVGEASGNDALAGTIRYSNLTAGAYDLEVKIGGQWVSLTASNNPPVSSVNGKSGNVTLVTGDISDATSANKYFSNTLAIAAPINGFDTNAASASLLASDSILTAINKLNANDKTKIGGTVPATSGLITYGSGTAGTVTTNGNLSFTNSSNGGYISVGQLTLGSDSPNHNYIQGQQAKFSLLASGSASKIELYSSGYMLLGGEVRSSGPAYFGSDTAASAHVDIEPGSPTMPSLRIRAGGNVDTPDDGAVWYNGSKLLASIGGTNKDMAAWTSTTAGINLASGKLGIGVSSPTEYLEVNGAVKISDAVGADSGEGTIKYKSGVFQGRTSAGWQTFGSGAVASVNGQTGAVSLSTSNISEGSNKYFTDARAIAAAITGFSSTSGTLAATDSVLQAIQKLDGNISGKVSSQWSVTGDDIYYPAGRVGINGDRVWLSKTNQNIGGINVDVLMITLGDNSIVKLYKTDSLTTADGGAIDVFSPDTNAILENMRTRINELESRLQALGLL